MVLSARECSGMAHDGCKVGVRPAGVKSRAGAESSTVAFTYIVSRYIFRPVGSHRPRRARPADGPRTDTAPARRPREGATAMSEVHDPLPGPTDLFHVLLMALSGKRR